MTSDSSFRGGVEKKKIVEGESCFVQTTPQDTIETS